MLRLENISKYYYSKNNIVLALNHISCEFKQGEFVAITGESGSGKSTFLNVLSGLDTFEEGKLFVNDDEITHYTIEQLESYRNEYIGFVFQDYNIIESYSVLENVLSALLLQDLTQSERLEKAKQILSRVGLENHINQKASTLSGGEKQRTVIARALAKDAEIIVCDEPTGNLDPDTAHDILALLNEIAKDKLVIVVTHNYDQIEPYVTRKIRLYDGDIIEDEMIDDTDNTDPVSYGKTPYTVPPKNIIRMAWMMIKNMPKKTVFNVLIIGFIILSFMMAYATMLEAKNTPHQTSTPYFDNAMKHRLIVTKPDESAFTSEELDSIENTSDVIDVIPQDVIFDVLMVNGHFEQEFNETVFDHYVVKPASVLHEADLTSGRLPRNANEVVIGETELFNLNETIDLSPRHMIKEVNGLKTDMFSKTIVGFVSTPNDLDSNNHIYYHYDGLIELSSVGIYQQATPYLDIDKLRQYVLIPDIRIDNTLNDLEMMAYDMMFFDICRDFGYKEHMNDMDAGLCPVDEFIPVHDFYLSVITRFEDTPVSHDIIMLSQPVEPNALGQGIYMNQTTFDLLFSDDSYQVTVVVYDMYEAMNAKDDLEDMGYNVFYPAGVIEEEEALGVLAENLQLSIGFIIVILLVYFVGYFVLRTVTYTKRKDYVILRSIGATKHNILSMMLIEIVLLTLIALGVILLSLTLLGYRYRMIQDYMRYFTLSDYIILILSMIAMMSYMTYRMNHRLFKETVITSLRIE